MKILNITLVVILACISSEISYASKEPPKRKTTSDLKVPEGKRGKVKRPRFVGSSVAAAAGQESEQSYQGPPSSAAAASGASASADESAGR